MTQLSISMEIPDVLKIGVREVSHIYTESDRGEGHSTNNGHPHAYSRMARQEKTSERQERTSHGSVSVQREETISSHAV